MRCCSAQIEGIWESPNQTLEKAEPVFYEAAQAGAALISFPEQFATGWDPVSEKNIEPPDGATVTGFRELAKKYRIAVIGSFRESYPKKPKNTSIVIGKDGRILAAYSKIHLFTPENEDRAFTPGTDLAIFTLDDVRFGLAICYDLRFPEIFRLYRHKEVHAVIVPSAWPQSRLRYWELFIQSRAAENQLYVAGVNTTGTNPVDRYTGGSLTADPLGTIIARAGEGNELLYYDIDPIFVEKTRRAFPVENDRKDELYISLLRQQQT
ncbi:MAG TPA: nitrilase-related carbon-nitrogen hydrolase [Methanoregula sp.]|nr:nitrilase-related carbon-nitrogen hydrolase [Methanoregula sp.]